MKTRVDTRRWDFSDYANCAEQFCALMKLPILSHVYEWAQQNKELGLVQNGASSMNIDQLPFESVELILIRAAGHLFTTINKRTPSVHAGYNDCSVSDVVGNVGSPEAPEEAPETLFQARLSSIQT